MTSCLAALLLVLSAAVRAELPRDPETGIVRGGEPFRFEGSSKSAVLLLHGFSSTPSELRELGRRIQKAGMTADCPLFRGHGTRPEDMERYGWKDWYEQAEKEFRKLRGSYDRVYVVGFSMGGTLAYHLAARNHPDGIVVLAPMHGIAHKWYYVLPAEWWVWTAGRLMRFVSGEGREISLYDKSQAGRLKGYSRIPLASVRSLLRLVRVVRREAGRIDEPLLVIHSSKDNVTSCRKSRRFFERTASEDKRYILFRRSDHFITLDYDREEVLRETVGFLERLEKGRS